MVSDIKQAGPGRVGRPSEGSTVSSLRKGATSLRKFDWVTFGALAIIVLLGAYLRFYFDFMQSIAGGFPALSGGSDADFYFNVISYALGTGHQLLYDPLLNYPIGSFNPFLPFYVWSVVLLSWPVAFLLHIPVTGSIYSGQLTGVVVAYSSISALSGVGSIIVTYYLGKEMFSREAGLIAAAFMAFLPSIVSESTAGFGVHDPFILMMTAAFFFFVFRSLNTINGTRWVERWKRNDSRRPDFQSIGDGIVKYYKGNRTSILYAAMAGVVLAGIANAWEGYSYILVVVSLFYLVQSFIYKFKNRDTLALTAIFLLIGSILIVFAAPVYYNSHAIYPWYYVSVVFFIGTLLVGIIYTVARDIPWLTLLSALVAAVLILFGLLELADPHLLHSIMSRILTAQSYFIKSSVYTTIAEAQTPPFSLLALSLGGAVFFIAFAQMAYMLYRSPKGIPDSRMLMMIWFFIAAFMAVSTVRFVLDATTTFVLFAGEGLFSLIAWTNFGEVRKGLQTFGFSWAGARKAIKIKHILVVLFVAFVVVMPVVWSGIDAATPSNMKPSLNKQVYSVLPSFLRPAGYTLNSTSSPYYFGAFGYSLESSTTYFPDAWSFINNRTQNITPYSSRPAYLSWWDYGSAVITFANVPTVADDFQQGYQLASAFLFSQNESQAIALLAARVLNGAYIHYGNSLPQNLTDALQSYGINASYVQDVMSHPDSYKGLVLSNPDTYGPFASSVSGQNVMYAVLMATMSKIGLSNVVDLYQRVSQLTGNFIGFISVDARLFPFSATNTGVFYAPAFLGGRPIAGPGVYNIPYDYYTITATTSTGVSYPLQSIPAGSQVISYSINYQPMFYNMTLYRLFMGYSAYDLTGQNLSGLPGLSGNFLYTSQLANLQPMPGWMESHFEMVYRTAYYNPYPLKYVKAHPNDWRAISLQKAINLVNADPTFQSYTVDLSPQSDFQNGIVVTEYYPGAYVNGTVLMSNGQPAQGVRVTVLDQWGIPHDVVYTNAEGQYSAIAMQGKDTIVYSTGSLSTVSQNLSQVGSVLKEIQLNVSYSQAMRYSTINMTSGLPAYNINMGVTQLGQTALTGHIFFTTPTNTTYTPGVTLPVKNVAIQIVNTTSGLSYTVQAPDGFYNFSSVMPGVYNMYLVSGKYAILARTNVTVAYGFDTPEDLGLQPSYIVGKVLTPDGLPVGNAGVTVQGAQSNYTATVTTLANGTYSFSSLLPGNYTVFVSSGGYTSSHYTISAVSLNYTLTQGGFNLTALEEVTLSGYVTVGNSPAAHDTLYFYSSTGGIQPFSVTTGANGYYSLNIGAGRYTVYSIYYSGSSVYSLFNGVSLAGGSSSADFSLTAASTVTGSVVGPQGSPGAYASLDILTSSASLNFTSNNTGGFSILLPDGSYGVWASGGGGAYLGQFSAIGKTSLNLAETASSTYSGQVETTVSGIRQNLTGASISFPYGDFTYYGFTNLTGSYSFDLPSSLQTTAMVTSYGMESTNVTLSSSTAGYRQVALVPLDVRFSGSVSNGVQLPAGTVLTLTATNGTTLSLAISGGSYSASVAPGFYTVSFAGYNDSAVRYSLQASKTNITVPVGPAFGFNTVVVVKYNLTIYFSYPASSGISNSTALSRVDIFSPALSSPLAIDSFTNGGSLYLAGATYTVYAYSSVKGSAFAFLNILTLNGHAVYTIAMQPELNLTGTVTYGSRTLGSASVFITSSAGAKVQAAVQSDGSFAVSLPSSGYTINASYTSTANISGKTRYVQYSGQLSINLTSALDVNVQTTLRELNSTVQGTTSWFYNLPVQSQLKFIAESATAISATTTTDGNGAYSLSLAPGNYTVETYSSDGTGSNITQFYVTPGANSSFDPVLNFAYMVQGSVTLPGSGPVDASITFNGSGGIFSVDAVNGGFSLLVPGGNYTLTANYTIASEGTAYLYGYSASIQVTAPTQMQIALQLAPTYGVKLTALSTQLSQAPDGFTQLSLLVNNTGDIPDVFYMSVDTSNWFGSFSPTYVVLGTGANSTAVVNVTLSSSNPSGGYNNVRFSATSLLSSSARNATSASVQVPEYYAFSAAFSAYGAEKVGRTISFSIVVNNTGNTVSNFQASVSNLVGLNSEGWSGGIYTTSNGPFYNTTYFTLEPHKNQTLTVSLTATSANPTAILPVGVNITQKETGFSYSISVPISLPSPVVPLNGISVTGQGASVMPPPLITLKRAAAIFALASLIVASVYYAKKRRLIR